MYIYQNQHNKEVLIIRDIIIYLAMINPQGLTKKITIHLVILKLDKMMLFFTIHLKTIKILFKHSPHHRFNHYNNISLVKMLTI